MTRFPVFLLSFLLLCTAVPAAGQTPLHDAVRNGDEANVKTLLAGGANVNAKNNDGATPLHWAAGEGKKGIAELLLAKGADVNARDNDGDTPLKWAAMNGWKEIVELLNAKGASSFDPPAYAAPTEAMLREALLSARLKDVPSSR
ncbi:MAG: ankyrin repeat domain-containing protein [Burkholderiales bacterium]|nr:ankyrin repeat domain-containing protein [Burkholderiales bacterium]